MVVRRMVVAKQKQSGASVHEKRQTWQKFGIPSTLAIGFYQL